MAQQLGHGLDLLALLVPVWALDAYRFGAVSQQTRPVAMSGILRDHILDQPSLPLVLWFHHVLRGEDPGRYRWTAWTQSFPGQPPLCSRGLEIGGARVGTFLPGYVSSGNPAGHLQQRIWWPSQDDIQDFVKACSVCKLRKQPCQAPSGLRQPLPVPRRPWS